MSRLTIIAICIAAVVINCLMNGCDARRLDDYDLEVAASDKHEWKKGEESDHHQSGFDSHGKKGEKGYEEKHGYVSHIYQSFFSRFWCKISK